MLEAPDQDSFPHRELTEKIIGAAFEVHKHLGYGDRTEARTLNKFWPKPGRISTLSFLNLCFICVYLWLKNPHS